MWRSRSSDIAAGAAIGIIVSRVALIIDTGTITLGGVLVLLIATASLLVWWAANRRKLS